MEGVIAKNRAHDIPILMSFLQNGDKAKGWLGAPFWWPVLYMPERCPVSVYASQRART